MLQGSKTYPIQGTGEMALDGWTILNGFSFVYASANSMICPANLLNVLSVGDKVKLTNSTLKFFYVVSFTWDGANTTIVLTAGSDYALDSGSPVVGVYISKLETPNAFPEWFNWTPTFSGFSANPAGGLYRFRVSGRSCTIAIRQPNTGTSNAGNFSISPPIPGRTIANMAWECSAQVRNSGAVQTTSGRFIISNVDVNTITVSLNYAGAGFTASGGKAANGTLVYEI